MNLNRSVLHNMSAPPKSVMKYEGLSGLATSLGPGGSGVTSMKYRPGRHYGKAVRVALPAVLQGASILDVLSALGEIDEGKGLPFTPERRLATLINRRASELPLPDGCAVIKAHPKHCVIWDDPLTVLAILSKSTETVWLRSKSPAIKSALQRDAISLLIPPAFIDRLEETKR